MECARFALIWNVIFRGKTAIFEQNVRISGGWGVKSTKCLDIGSVREKTKMAFGDRTFCPCAGRALTLSLEEK